MFAVMTLLVSVAPHDFPMDDGVGIVREHIELIWRRPEQATLLKHDMAQCQHAKTYAESVVVLLARDVKMCTDSFQFTHEGVGICLELQFAQATEALTLASYKAFQNLCKVAEWAGYEPKMLAAVERARPQERLKVHMHSEEYDQAINILSKMRYPDDRFGGDDLLKIAARLEERYPDQILAFYMSGLGKLNQSMQREPYAQKAKIARKVRYMCLDVIKAPEKWEAFARQVKTANLKRPAFQEEFAKLLPGWNAM